MHPGSCFACAVAFQGAAATLAATLPPPSAPVPPGAAGTGSMPAWGSWHNPGRSARRWPGRSRPAAALLGQGGARLAVTAHALAAAASRALAWLAAIGPPHGLFRQRTAVEAEKGASRTGGCSPCTVCTKGWLLPMQGVRPSPDSASYAALIPSASCAHPLPPSPGGPSCAPLTRQRVHPEVEAQVVLGQLALAGHQLALLVARHSEVDGDVDDNQQLHRAAAGGCQRV